MFFLSLVKKVSNVFRIHFSKIMECFFVSGVLFSFSSMGTRKNHKAQTQEKLQGKIRKIMKANKLVPSTWTSLERQ